MPALEHRTDDQRTKRSQHEAAIFAACEALLQEGIPYSDLRIEQIATRAGISRTAFYFYFRDKRELLLRLTDELADLLYKEAEGWWAGDGDSVAELEHALRSVVSLYADHGSLLRAVVEASAYDAQVAQFWRELAGRFAEATRSRIEKEQELATVAPEIPAAETAFSLCWMTERSCYQHLVGGGDPRDEAFLAGLIGIWRRAIYGRVDQERRETL
ncbi:MAG TPA: helix-turn-helix domain-containing protein [Solirubrobacteraceae bacterium]|nr:helix-turn-helix domain-containing protein [Solirubrobacteraceae bacterium]